MSPNGINNNTISTEMTTFPISWLKSQSNGPFIDFKPPFANDTNRSRKNISPKRVAARRKKNKAKRAQKKRL